MRKTAFITGAAKRLGKEMALHLAKQGWNVGIHYLTSKQLADEFLQQLKDQFPSQHFEGFQANLANEDEVNSLLLKVIEKIGQVDLLINNASVFDHAYIKHTESRIYNAQMDVNLRAPFILIHNYSRLTNKGLVVNLVDTRITNNKSDYAAYSLSKKALWELTKMAALELAPKFRVNAIAPGVTLSPEDKDENYLKKLARKTPMKKPSDVDPILRSLDYIISNNHLTGQLLFADGGENLGLNP